MVAGIPAQASGPAALTTWRPARRSGPGVTIITSAAAVPAAGSGRAHRRQPRCAEAQGRPARPGPDTVRRRPGPDACDRPGANARACSGLSDPRAGWRTSPPVRQRGSSPSARGTSGCLTRRVHGSQLGTGLTGARGRAIGAVPSRPGSCCRAGVSAAAPLAAASSRYLALSRMASADSGELASCCSSQPASFAVADDSGRAGQHGGCGGQGGDPDGIGGGTREGAHDFFSRKVWAVTVRLPQCPAGDNPSR